MEFLVTVNIHSPHGQRVIGEMFSRALIEQSKLIQFNWTIINVNLVDAMSCPTFEVFFLRMRASLHVMRPIITSRVLRFARKIIDDFRMRFANELEKSSPTTPRLMKKLAELLSKIHVIIELQLFQGLWRLENFQRFKIFELSFHVAGFGFRKDVICGCLNISHATFRCITRNTHRTAFVFV